MERTAASWLPFRDSITASVSRMSGKSGAIVAQMDIGTREADLKLYGPDKKEIVSKEVVKSGMIHHITSELGEYYILVADANISNSPYELVLDIV